jgi:hypothetical protein
MLRAAGRRSLFTSMSRTSSAASSSSTRPRSRAARAIVWGGLLCGTLDISAAFFFAGRKHIGPVRVLQGIAEALVGPASYRGGAATAALGLLMHFGVAFAATAVFFVLSRRFPALARWPVPAGLLYGAAVWITMYRVVIPLTVAANALYLTEFDRGIPALRLRQLFIHFFCVGLPIALTVRFLGEIRPAADG